MIVITWNIHPDELGQGTQRALLEVIRLLNVHKVWIICAAGNYGQDRTSAGNLRQYVDTVPAGYQRGVTHLDTFDRVLSVGMCDLSGTPDIFSQKVLIGSQLYAPGQDILCADVSGSGDDEASGTSFGK